MKKGGEKDSDGHIISLDESDPNEWLTQAGINDSIYSEDGQSVND